MKSINLSIILPIYNVEQYLSDCIDSIINAVGSEQLEILLINDGSTDKSGRIADYYSNKFDNIRVYHKENGGLSDARNYGLSKAIGKYVFFLDSDDFLKPQAINRIIEVATNYNEDVIVWDASVVNETGKKNKEIDYEFSHPGIESIKPYPPNEFLLNQLVCRNDYVTTVWLGMYKREFLIDNSLWFKKGILHEDELWTPITFLKAQNIIYLDESLYCYRIRNDSIMNQKNKNYSRNLRDSIFIFNILPSHYDYLVNDDVLLKKIKANNSKRYLHAIAKYDAYKYKDLCKRINKFDLLRNSNGLKDKIRSIVLFFSMRLYCELSKMIEQH